MHFENDSIDDLRKFINSPDFKGIEISKSIAEALIKKCEEHGLRKEIQIIETVTFKRVN